MRLYLHACCRVHSSCGWWGGYIFACMIKYAHFLSAFYVNFVFRSRREFLSFFIWFHKYEIVTT